MIRPQSLCSNSPSVNDYDLSASEAMAYKRLLGEFKRFCTISRKQIWLEFGA